MDDGCDLRAADGVVAHCDGDRCTFWRAVEHLDVGVRQEGCAIRHFELLGDDRGSEIAKWLLSVKARVDAQEPVDA